MPFFAICEHQKHSIHPGGDIIRMLDAFESIIVHFRGGGGGLGGNGVTSAKPSPVSRTISSSIFRLICAGHRWNAVTAQSRL